MIINGNPLLVILVLTSFVCFVQAQATDNATDNTTENSTSSPQGEDGPGREEFVGPCHKCANGIAETKMCRQGSNGMRVTKDCPTVQQFLGEYSMDIQEYGKRHTLKLGQPRDSSHSGNDNTTGMPSVTLCVSLGFNHSSRHSGMYTMRNCIMDEKGRIEDGFKEYFKVPELTLPFNNDDGRIAEMYCVSQLIPDRLVINTVKICFCNDKPNCNVYNYDANLCCLARAWSGAVLVGIVTSVRLLGQFINVD